LPGQARAMQEFSFQVFEAFTGATVLYLLINIVVVIGMRFLERVRPFVPTCVPSEVFTSNTYIFMWRRMKPWRIRADSPDVPW
jgi:hypothetical protein